MQSDRFLVIRTFLKGKDNLIQKIYFANICFALLVWNVCIATPLDIYRSNPNEFFQMYGALLLKTGIQYAVYFWIILNIFLLCLLLFKEPIQKLSLMLLFVIAVSSWINATFLVGEYGVFDGRGNLNIDRFSFISLLQIAIFLLLLSVAFFFRKNLNRLNFISCFVLSISVLTCLLNIILLKIERLNSL